MFNLSCCCYFANNCVIISQCPKLRVHPTPGVHISTAGCTILIGVHPVCARFLSHLLLLYIGRVHGAISGCTVLWEVHPASARNKSLISDTVSVVVFQAYILIILLLYVGDAMLLSATPDLFPLGFTRMELLIKFLYLESC